MKAAAITGALVAALAAGAVVTPTFAQPYGYAYDNDCRQQAHSNGAAGAIIGGIAGAVIGSNLAAHHGGRAGGTALGAIAGAALGNSIARSSTQSCGYSGRAYYDNAYRTSYVERRDYDRGYDNRYGDNSYGYGRYNQDAYAYRPYGGDYSRSYSPY
jgi:Glycine zipper 2TM domain